MANFGDGTVYIIDAVTNNIIDTVNVGSRPLGVEVNPTGTKVYVANSGDGTISVIDTATNTVKSTVPVGSNPYEVAGNPDGTRMYVANLDSNNVSVIDTATDNIVATVNVGKWPYGVAVSPDRTKIYVTNFDDNTVSVINSTTNTVIATLPVGNHPGGVAINQDGKKVYVANFGDNNVSVIDTEANNITATVNVGNGPRAFGKFICSVLTQSVLPVANFSSNVTTGVAPLSVQFTDKSLNAANVSWDFENDGLVDSRSRNPIHLYGVPGNYTVNLTASNENGTKSKLATIIVGKGPYAYITNAGSNSVSVIDTATNNIIATVPVGSSPDGVTVDLEGKKVYVANLGSNNVSVIDATTNSVTATVPVGTHPEGVAVNPDGTKVFVTNLDSADVSVINTTTNTVTATLDVGITPTGVAVTPDGSKVYVTNANSNNVSVINTTTNTVTATVDIGSYPMGVAINPAGTKAYVANANSNNVSVINTTTNTVTATVDVESYPVGVAVNPSGTKVYVGNKLSNTVSVIDTVNNTVTASVSVGTNPEGIAVTPDGKKVYVANLESNNVSVINTANNTVTATVDVGSHPIAYGLFIGGQPEKPVLPVANFSTSVTSGYTPLSVQFNDSSLNATAWNWDFGDGANSTQQNPTHVYSVKGNYTVNLTVSNVNGTDSKTAEITPYTPPYAYIPNQVSNNVSVINTANNRVVASVNVGSYPYGVAVNQNGTKVYVTNQGSYTVSVINTTTNTVSATVKGFYYPQGVAVRPDGKKVYVANYFGKNVSVIDTATNNITATVKVGDYPNGIAVNSAGTKVYVTNQGNNNISVIDTSNNTVVASVNVEGSPYGVAVNPDGTKVYAALYANGKVSVIDTSNNTVVASVNVGSTLYNLAVNPEGTKVYVACWLTGKVSVIDTSNNTVVASVNAVNSPYGIAVNPKGTKVYVANYNDDRVTVIDTATNTVTTTVPVGNSPSAFGQFITIGVEPVLPVANFSSNVTSGYVPLSVQFTDLSKSATALNWDFGDETNSTQQNPMHTFSAAGNYTVNLTASNLNGTNSKTAVITVSAQQVLPVANFSTSVTSGYAPLSVQFTNLSENATGVRGDFGDGANSTEQNPMHTYLAVGVYTVNLTVNNANGTDSKLATITVSEKPVLPVANFSSNVTEDFVPLAIQFNDSSENATYLSWDFDYDGTPDSIPDSIDVNPIHVYEVPGTYTVNLTASNGDGTDSKSTTINVLKAIPEINWNNPTDIVYGTPLNGTQLNALAPIPGNFAYTPTNGIILGVGMQTLQVDFTPEDATNYTNASKNITVNILQATPEITWDTPADIVYGTALNGTQLNALVSVPGNLNYTPAEGTVLSVGNQTLSVDFTPEDSTNYTNASKNVTVNVTSDTPEITWGNPEDMIYGRELNNTQLNA